MRAKLEVIITTLKLKEKFNQILREAIEMPDDGRLTNKVWNDLADFIPGASAMLFEEFKMTPVQFRQRVSMGYVSHKRAVETVINGYFKILQG